MRCSPKIPRLSYIMWTYIKMCTYAWECGGILREIQLIGENCRIHSEKYRYSNLQHNVLHVCGFTRNPGHIFQIRKHRNTEGNDFEKIYIDKHKNFIFYHVQSNSPFDELAYCTLISKIKKYLKTSKWILFLLVRNLPQSWDAAWKELFSKVHSN